MLSWFLRVGQDAVALVLDDPAAREGHRDAHVRVIEAVVAHHALGAAGAEGHALDGLHVGVAVDRRSRFSGSATSAAARAAATAAVVGRGVVGKHAVVHARLAPFLAGAAISKFSWALSTSNMARMARGS